MHKAFMVVEILYILRLNSGTQVLSLLHSHHEHAIGEELNLQHAPDHMVIFRADEQMYQPA